MIKENGVLDSSRRIVKNENWKLRKNYGSAAFEKFAINALLKNRLLAAQNDEIFNDLLPFLENVTLTGGKCLYQPGDQINFIYFPETAIFSEYQILEDGRTIEVAMIGNEGVLGLLPVFNSYHAANWAQVCVGGSAARIDSRIFEKKISRHPAFQKSLFEYINDYVGQISQRAVCNSYHRIEKRFCSWLLMLQSRQKSNRLPLTQEQIARALGIHRPSLTHIAQTLRAKKIIDYVRANIYILDRAALEESACACFSEIESFRQQFYPKRMTERQKAQIF